MSQIAQVNVVTIHGDISYGEKSIESSIRSIDCSVPQRRLIALLVIRNFRLVRRSGTCWVTSRRQVTAWSRIDQPAIAVESRNLTIGRGQWGQAEDLRWVGPGQRRGCNKKYWIASENFCSLGELCCFVVCPKSWLPFATQWTLQCSVTCPLVPHWLK